MLFLPFYFRLRFRLVFHCIFISSIIFFMKVFSIFYVLVLVFISLLPSMVFSCYRIISYVRFVVLWHCRGRFSLIENYPLHLLFFYRVCSDHYLKLLMKILDAVGLLTNFTFSSFRSRTTLALINLWSLPV